MTKRQFTVVFTAVSTVVNILMALAIMGVLIMLSTLVLSKVLGVENGTVYLVVWMVCFLGGMLLDMFLFSKLCAWAVDTYFYDKLDANVVGKYLPGGKNVSARAKAQKLKTNMPASVLPQEDTFGQE